MRCFLHRKKANNAMIATAKKPPIAMPAIAPPLSVGPGVGEVDAGGMKVTVSGFLLKVGMAVVLGVGGGVVVGSYVDGVGVGEGVLGVRVGVERVVGPVRVVWVVVPAVLSQRTAVNGWAPPYKYWVLQYGAVVWPLQYGTIYQQQ